MNAKSKIGFHTAGGGNKNGLGEWERRLNEAGIPVYIKSSDEYGVLGEALAFGDQYGVENNLVFRIVLEKPHDVPDYYIDPRDSADEYWQRIIGIDRFPPEFDKERVWLDVLNEPRAQIDFDSPNWGDMHPVAWLGAFSIRIGEIALRDGYKVCLPSFNGGEPNENDYEHPEWLDFLQMCGEYPERIALSVHEYAWSLWQDDPNPENWYPHLWGRLENFIAACDMNGVSRDITIFVTEFGFGHDGHTIPPVSQGMEFLRWYDEWAAKWPQVRGAALWSLQSGWADVANAVQPYIAPLTEYQLSNEFPMGDQPAQTYLGTLPGIEPEPPYPPIDPPVEPPLPAGNLIANWSFEDGWENLPPVAGDLINQKPNGFNLYWHPIGEELWAVNQKTREMPVCATIPECLHKLNEQLPPNEQLGGIDALILDGGTCYKVFARGGPWGVVLSQPLAGLLPNTAVLITVPLQVHYQTPVNDDSPDDVEVWLTAGDEKRVFTATPDLPNREWVNLEIEAVTDEYGRLPIGLRLQTKWANNRDIFTDTWTVVYVQETEPPVEPPVTPPADCIGLPREQYRRVVHVYPSATSPARAAEIAAYAYERGRQTVGGSYDDAGIGALDVKTAVLWDMPASRLSEFVDWYALHYAGTAVEFMDVIDDINGVTLDVPHMSQNGGDADARSNDCGAACVAMIVNGQTESSPSVDDVAIAYQNPPNSYMSFNQLDQALNGYGMDGTHERPFVVAGFEMRIEAGYPVIALVGYQSLPYQFSSFDGTHFIVVYATREAGTFLYRDPLAPDGRELRISGEELIGAMENVGNNMPLQGMWTEVKNAVEPPVPPPSGDYEYNGRPVTYTPAIHAPADDWRWSAVSGMIDFLGIPVKFMSNGNSADWFGARVGRGFSLIRLMHNFSTHITPEKLYNDAWRGEIARFHALGGRDFELHNEPNLPSEGLGVVWNNGTDFGNYMVAVTRLIRADFPDVRLWFPGMSPGVPWTNQLAFTNEAWPILGPHCNGFAMHAYTGNNSDAVTAVGEIVNQVVELQEYLNLQIPIAVSECSVNRGTDYAQKAAVYQGVDASLLSVAGVQSCAYYISDWYSPPPEQAGHGESWFGTPMAELYKNG